MLPMPIKFQFFKNLVLKCVDFWFLLGGLRQDVKGTSHIPETYFLNELFSKLYSGDIMSVCEMKQNDFKTRICEIALSGTLTVCGFSVFIDFLCGFAVLLIEFQSLHF